jgi:hypothetical protein
MRGRTIGGPSWFVTRLQSAITSGIVTGVRVLISVFVPVTVLITAVAHLIVPVVDHIQTHPHAGPPAIIDVNRPRNPFDCDLPIGINWYGTRERCLAELCAGKNVYNEYIFDAGDRRRKNPCYGQSPTEFEGK